jgi:hypothetical protein
MTEIAEIARKHKGRPGTKLRKSSNAPPTSARRRNIQKQTELFCCGDACSAGHESGFNILFPCGSSLRVPLTPILAAGYCAKGVEARLHDVYGLRREGHVLVAPFPFIRDENDEPSLVPDLINSLAACGMSPKTAQGFNPRLVWGGSC